MLIKRAVFFLFFSNYLIAMALAEDDSVLKYAQSAVNKADHLLNSGKLNSLAPPEGLQESFRLLNEARKSQRLERFEESQNFSESAWLLAHRFVEKWKYEEQVDIALRSNKDKNFVAVKSGKLSVNVGGKRITLNEGEGLSASKQGATEKIKLLAAPQILNISNKEIIVYNKRQVEINLKKTEGSTRCAIDVAIDLQFNQKIVKSREFEGTSYIVEGRFQQSLYVRFTSIDSNGLPGKHGDVLKISFVEDRRAPVIELKPHLWE